MKSGNLNFQEPSGPLQACNGTALPFLPNTFTEGGLKLAGYALILGKVILGQWIPLRISE